MPVIEATGLGMRYGGRAALVDVSLTVERGEIFGLLGPNGAGKTTLVETLEGLRKPTSGRVRVLGVDPVRDAPSLRQRLGVQLQQTQLPERLKVWEALRLFASFYDAPSDWRQLLETWGLSDVRDTAFGKLSGGQQQRLVIALALVGNPSVAIFDELTTGLDPHARRGTWGLIRRVREGGVTVLLVSHFMDEVEALCDRVAVMQHGRIVATDTPAKLVERSGAERTMRFTALTEPSARTLAELRALPGVSDVRTIGADVVVRGRGDFVAPAATRLTRDGISIAQLRVEEPTLDAAFAQLTGERFGP